MGESLTTHHEDHIAGKGDNSLQHYNLVHNFSHASSHENSRSKGSSGQGMGKIREKFGVEPDESQKQKRDEARTKGAKVHFASLVDTRHLKMLNWRQSTKNTKVELYSEATL